MPLTSAEQYLLELTNRARLDPLAEAARFGINLNDNLAPGTISSAPKGALAPNELLHQSSDGHSAWMLDTDTFSHTGDGGSRAGDRMEDAGYTFTGDWTWGENLAWWGSTGSINLNESIAIHHEGLFRSAGHRENTLADGFREIGIAQVQGVFTVQGTNYNTSMTTLNFARSGIAMFVTGVAYTDADADGFYSIGEGRANVTFQVSGSGFSTGQDTTETGGGYSVAAPEGLGTATVTITHGGNTTVVEVQRGFGNVKLDLVGDNTLLASGDVRLLSGPITDMRVLGAVEANLIGSAAANRLSGNVANNMLDGGDGHDTLVGESGNDTVIGGSGNDSLWGGNWADSLFGGFGDDRLHGESGSDWMEAGTGNDSLFGGTGNDTLWGHAGSDLLRAAEGNDLVYGGGDDDNAEGGSGNDRLYGEDGNDSLSGQTGNDSLWGGTGNDTLTGGDWADTLRGEDGSDQLHGDASNDWLYGGSSGDGLFGGTGNDRLHGETGADTLFGGDGNDQLFGGEGNDQVTGGAGNDRLDGSANNDTLTGGTGADVFVLKSGGGDDTITDFSRAQGDRIVLDANLFDPGTTLEEVLATYTTTTVDGLLLTTDDGHSFLLGGVASLQTGDIAWL
jgi:Ca2+-binding RTX toxin-like protein